ncbi:response regulator [Desulfolutivibrio sulfodismutans DSM 3696]|nr:response regulator [Desulfolutivibrio sulfodismutans]QLA11218.1 response regulator [Desulfolutivibrio sulfodismutans DSM 3696]
MEQKVLIVDSDPLALAYHTHILSRHFCVATAQNAAEALNRLRQNGPFSVVVSDLFLPSPDGRSFLSKVRRLCPDIVHIVLADNPTPETIMNVINNNTIFGFFCKSAPPTKVIRKIRAALELHRQQTSLPLPYTRDVLSQEERSFLNELACSRPC